MPGTTRKYANEYPGRVHAVFIRDVDPDDDSNEDRKVDSIVSQQKQDGLIFLRVRDSSAIAKQLENAGLLSSAGVARIVAEMASSSTVH